METNKQYYIVYKNDCYDFQRDHGADETHYDGKIHTQKLIIYGENEDMLLAKGFYLGCKYSANTNITPFRKTDVVSMDMLAENLDKLTCKAHSYAVGCAGIFYCTESELGKIIEILDHHTERERLIYVISQISKYVNSIRIEKSRYQNAMNEYHTFKKTHKDDIDKIINECKKFNLEEYISELIPVIETVK